VNRSKEQQSVLPYYEKMRVKSPSMETPSITLSGGNQQKLVIAKWLAAQCDVLLVDEPTRGVDVGAKAEIHELLRDLASSGKAILLVSSDMPELLALSDRVVVLREGVQIGELEGHRADETNVMSMMAGLA
jgi:ribose transport system ATP-binding protein